MSEPFLHDTNKDVVRRFFEVIAAQKLDALDDLVTDDFVWHGGSFGDLSGVDAFKELVKPFLAAFPDLALAVADQLAEGDRVASRLITTGTHEGEFFGVRPTGKQVRYGEQPIHRIADGRVAEIWWAADVFGLMQQLGAIPSGQEATA